VADGVLDVLADPVGVITALVASAEPAMARAEIERLVTGVAGSRAKRRRLAGALAGRPSVLADGRSPAPRAVGDLLIALRGAGATSVPAPACAGCGKDLRTLQRRGQDWYCNACSLRPGWCAACGQQRLIVSADRRGQPRCAGCPDRDERDPLAVLTEVVTRADPSLTAGQVTAAAQRAFARPSGLRRLAWAVEDAPGLLTGGGAEAPSPGVLRFIGELRSAGAQAIIAPACPGCQRVIALYRQAGGQWLCRNCIAKGRARPCSRCGAVREPAARDPAGQPLCSYCLTSDPANQEPCVSCGRTRRVAARGPGGPLCLACLPAKAMTCSICGRHTTAWRSRATGEPWCSACRGRWARCTRCGKMAQVRSGTRNEPLCGGCTRPGIWHSCPACGQPGRMIAAGACERCTADRRLRELLGDQDGQIRPQFHALYQALAAADRPDTVTAWLDKSAAPQVLHGLGSTRQLTHQALDELTPRQAADHLRSVLVAAGALPPRDERLIRLERWTAKTIAGRPDQQVLRRYATWQVLRRLRGRLRGTHLTTGQDEAARRSIRAAAALLDWLTTRDLTLAAARQGDLDTWLACAPAALRYPAGNFVRWARKQKLTELDLAAIKWAGPSGVMDTETRWEQARWLLHDDTPEPGDRVAGLLVLLYAQWPATISRLTTGHLQASDGHVRIRLGQEPVLLPAPLDALVSQLAATPRGHAAIGSQDHSPWLFPGGQPGQPITPSRMAERLRQLGIHPGQARSTALFQLAAELPAALLARMLGIHITVAVAWQHASAGDWTSYAADVSRRRQPGPAGHSDTSDI
jgi:hypothetical protein